MATALFSKLPLSVIIGKVEFVVNTDFRIMAEFENAIMNTDRNSRAKMAEIFTTTAQRFYKGNVPQDINVAIDRMWWFYRCGEKATSQRNTSGNGSNNQRLYDYEIDSARIISAFKAQYNIDLTSENLHWWLFKSYFTDLDPECNFVKIMSYRGINLKDIKNNKERARYKQLKELYKLPTVKTTPLTKEERDELFKQRLSRQLSR